MRCRHCPNLAASAIFTCVLGLSPFGTLQAGEDIEPYLMVRSLQFIQDSVVSGDDESAPMQRFMLQAIDQRLREVSSGVFRSPRNADAVLIYAMSGGNPATLEYLVAHDIDGNFDNRLTDALRKYLSGKGVLVSKTLADLFPEYRNSRLAPYVALVAGNTAATGSNPQEALEFYDWARLKAPGTIVEEAALRRSLAISIKEKLPEKATAYACKYVRRFLRSPYAGQVVDLLVGHIVDHYAAADLDDVDAMLFYMDRDHRRQTYLRVARRAAIGGMTDLARMTSERAEELSGAADGARALASLYKNMVAISSGQTVSAMNAIAEIPDKALTPQDQALKEAAWTVAEEMLRKPLPFASLQDLASKGGEKTAPGAVAQYETQDSAPDMNPGIRSFVDQGRARLAEIDKLLEDEKTQ